MVFSTTFNAVALLAVVPAVTAQWGSVGGIDVTMCSGYMLRLDEVRATATEHAPPEQLSRRAARQLTPAAAARADEHRVLLDGARRSVRERLPHGVQPAVRRHLRQLQRKFGVFFFLAPESRATLSAVAPARAR